MFERLASTCHRLRWLVIATWIIAAVGVSVIAASASGEYAGGGRLEGTDSDAAYQIFHAEFGNSTEESAAVVFHDTGGVAESQAAIESYLATITQSAHLTDAPSPFDVPGHVSASGDTAYTDISFGDDYPDSALTTRAELMSDAAAQLRASGVQVEFLGDRFVEGGVPSSELFGLLAAAIILLIAFGSVVAMGLPIFTAIIGIVIGLAGVSLWANVLDTPDFTVQVASMVGIGVGIDYALFIVTRYREAQARGAQPLDATIEAINTAGRAVAFAGCTVMISLLGMFLMGLPFLYGLAVGTSTAVFVAVLAALTLIPALLGVVGRHLDRLSVHRRGISNRETMWHRWSRLVQRHPVRFAVGGFLALVIAASPVLAMRLASADSGNDPKASTTRQAYDLLADEFGPGFNGPLLIVVSTPDEASRALVAALPDSIESTPGVANVGDVVASPSGDAALLTVVPTSAPQDEATFDLVHRLRADVLPATGLDAHVGGQTASNVDFSSQMSDRLPIFIGAVLLLSFLLLMAVFRSVLVPLKAVIMNLLSIGAAYGLMVAVFQWGWLGGLIGIESGAPIEPWAPMMLFAIVFGLSMDYEVFLLSSIKERYAATGNNSHAVVEGLASTARVITAAAAIMVCVFGSFILGDMRAIKLIGLGLSAAVLIDATVVRMVLVPATMELLGRRNWWMPRWLDRVVPNLDIERHEPAIAASAGDATGPADDRQPVGAGAR